MTSLEYSQQLSQINDPHAKSLALYYSKIKPIKTVYVKSFAFDCIPFDQQQGIIDRPLHEKQIMVDSAKKVAAENLEWLQLPENKELLKNMLSQQTNGCPLGSISQVRPSDEHLYAALPSNLKSSHNLTGDPKINYGYSDMDFKYFPKLTVDMNTQPPEVPVGGITPNVFFAADDIHAYTPTHPGECIINVQWLTSPNYPNQSIEYGWQTWYGVAPFLFSYGNSNNWGQGWPGNIPVVQMPNEPFPLNQPNNYHASLSLYYIMSSKGPNDPKCLNDPYGCYVMQVATMDKGVRTSGFRGVGLYTKKPGYLDAEKKINNFVYQGFTLWTFGLELQCQTSKQGVKCYYPVCAAGAFYNAGTTYLSTTNERTFSLQNFTKGPTGISSIWSPGALPAGKMEFSGCSYIGQ